MRPRHPRSTLFPYTTLFRSVRSLLRELWQSRDLVRMLARKEFFVRYRRASFGLLWAVGLPLFQAVVMAVRSEEHTSELQSQSNLVCRLLLEKKKKKKHNIT